MFKKTYVGYSPGAGKISAQEFPGKQGPHFSGLKNFTGEAVYVDCLYFNLKAMMVSSSLHAHAKSQIISVDASKALIKT
jgi:xanthine dehydrogenase molybdopterin-binding subunit B